VLIALGFAAWLGLSYSVIRMTWIFQVSLFSSFHFRDFWPGGISFPAFVPSCVMLFAPTLGLLASACSLRIVLPGSFERQDEFST
jgi:hypothetical protein